MLPRQVALGIVFWIFCSSLLQDSVQGLPYMQPFMPVGEATMLYNLSAKNSLTAAPCEPPLADGKGKTTEQ